MNVLYVSKALVVAAYRGKLSALAEHVNVHAVTPRRWGRCQPERGGREPTYVTTWLHGHNHLHVYPRAARWVDASRADLVHIDEEPYSLVTLQLARIARRRRIPAVFFAWQNLDKRLPPPFAKVRGAVFRHVSGGIAGTKAAAAVLRRAGFDGLLAVIPQFGVDATHFRHDAAHRCALRTRLDVPHDAFVVGYAGRLVSEKGVRVLLEAFGGVSDACLILIGDGPERTSLERIVRVAGLGDRVHFVGHVASLEMPRWLSALDLLVLPSVRTAGWQEQFGRVLVEAMACSVPVVATRSGELPHVIGTAGDVVPEGDAAALADAIGRLRDAPALRQERALAGRARVLAHYTHERIAGQTARFYTEIRSGARRT